MFSSLQCFAILKQLPTQNLHSNFLFQIGPFTFTLDSLINVLGVAVAGPGDPVDQQQQQPEENGQQKLFGMIKVITDHIYEIIHAIMKETSVVC